MNDAELDPTIRVLDLAFGLPGTIASFLVSGGDGPVLIETGPESTFGALERGLHAAGVAPASVRHVLLTHIHLDHAGAAWRLAELGATVYVHPVGAPHLADPSKLLASARRIYGERMDSLWGRLAPVPPERLRIVEDGEVLRFGGLTIEALHTPGHANHHIAYRLDGTVFTGDVGGVRMTGGPAVPPCPPPDIDLEAWHRSISRLRAVSPRCLVLTHFGAFADVSSHLDQLEAGLEAFAGWIRERMGGGMDDTAMVAPFEEFTGSFLAARGAGEATLRLYALANPAFMSVAGLSRYWRNREREVAPTRRG